jgi:single-strand DNA-binding protein
MNKVILIGRLTKDVDIRYTEAGKAVANFTLAADRPFKNQQGEKEADFIRIVVWGKQAENCANYIGKGRLVAVSGRLQIRSYEGKDGQRRYITEVVAEEVRFLDKPKNENSGDGYEPTSEFSGEYEEMEGTPF